MGREGKRKNHRYSVKKGGTAFAAMSFDGSVPFLRIRREVLAKCPRACATRLFIIKGNAYEDVEKDGTINR